MSRNSPSLSPQGFWRPSNPESAAPNSRHSGGQDPPRPAADGFEWVWFPEGYWAERPTQRRASSKNHGTTSAGSAGKMFRWTSRASGVTATPHEHEPRGLSPKTAKSYPALTVQQGNQRKKSSGSFSPARTLPQSPWLSEAAQVQALQRPVDQQMGFSGMRSLNEQSRHARKSSSAESGFFSVLQGRAMAAKSKSSWNVFHRPKIKNPAEVLPEPSKEETVEATPSYFTQKPTSPPQPHTPPEVKKGNDAHGPLRSLRKWFSRTPQSRKDNESPPTRQTSASSRSSHKYFASKLPISSAGGADDYRKLQASDAMKSYPADEAIAVRTSPLKQSADGRTRNLFFEIKHRVPTDTSLSSSESSARAAPRVFSYRKRDPVKGISYFEFDVPEHLPSSPMCPANPMHKLKGKGVCVFHGRAKQVSEDDRAGIADEDMTERA